MKTIYKISILMFAILTIISCKHSHNNSGGHAHPHDNNTDSHSGHNHGDDAHSGHNHAATSVKTMSYTVFSDGYELFVEFPALVVGRESKLLAHITRLSDYKPVADAMVAASLTNGDATDAVDKPRQAGIFTPVLEPETAAKTSMVIAMKLKDKTIEFKIDEVQVYQSSEKAPKDAHEDEGDDITFLKEQAWNGTFSIEMVKDKEFAEAFRCTGELLPKTEGEVTIVAPIAGIVNIESSGALSGKRVSVNQKLFTLSGSVSDNNYKTRLLKAKSEYEKSLNTFERSKELLKNKIVSQKEFDIHKANYLKAKAEYENLSSNYDSDGKNVMSPISGKITRIFVKQGDYVKAGQILAKVQNSGMVNLKVNVPKTKLKSFGTIKDANFKPEYSEEIYSVKNENGRRVETGAISTEISPYLELYFEIPNNGDFIPYSYCEVFLKSAYREAISVPVKSIMESEGNYLVYVQEAGETYKKREIIIGNSNGKRVEIIKGLKEGDIVVVNGAYRVKQASMSTAVPAHGHTH